MSAKSDYLEQAILNHLFRNTGLAVPATTYIALYTVAPTDAGGGTEVSGGSYGRFAATSGTSGTGSGSVWSAPATEGGGGYVVSNAAEVNFGTATADWGTVLAFGILDASSGGNLLYHNTLTTSRDILTGDEGRFAAGQLQIIER